MELETVVISLGGSIIVPEEIDVVFLIKFKDLVLGIKNKNLSLFVGAERFAGTSKMLQKKLERYQKMTLTGLGSGQPG